VVTDESNRVQGLISRSNLLRATPTRVALVDHNERSQAVEGIEEADIIAVIDHHRVADFQTRTPPFMRLEPVGSTSTIVGKLFAETEITLPPSLAGVLLSGILADTLMFRGPTTTAEDRRVGERLARQAGVALEELGDRILAIASDISNQTAEQLLTRDFKEFHVNGSRFGIGTIETTSGAAVLARCDELLEAMEGLQRREKYAEILFAVIDIVHQCTTLLVAAHPEATAMAFQTAACDGHSVEVPGILSRKKNIVPLLRTIAEEISGR
jgi:manganese-dependent inorganic pyrophosphatase